MYGYCTWIVLRQPLAAWSLRGSSAFKSEGAQSSTRRIGVLGLHNIGVVLPSSPVLAPTLVGRWLV